MDHVPLPEDPKFGRVRVPYYGPYYGPNYGPNFGEYIYDGCGFADYPDRCKFRSWRFHRTDFSDVPQQDRNSFFQAWLFFGLIHEFFGENLHDDFIEQDDRGLRVTTERLTDLAEEWIERLAKCEESKRMSECERVDSCLREARRMTFFLDSRIGRERTSSHLSEEVGLSITLLGTALDEIKGFVKEDILTPCWPISEFALKRLEAEGWCNSEVTRLQYTLSTHGVLYCTSMRRFGKNLDHSRCSEDECAAENITKGTYKTLHAEGCKGCEHDGPNDDEVNSVLAKNSFPVIALTKSETTSDVRINVLSHCESTVYTAISHVWVDGLGNELENTLPKCQILRLYRLLRGRVGGHKTSTVYLWIDTFCVPVKKKFLKLRKKAINLMYDVYSKAETVLVLDRSLFSTSAEQPTEELFFQITASPWMRRAWTFQEGALAKSVWVQFADRAIDLREAMVNLGTKWDYISQTYRPSRLATDSFKACAFLLSRDKNKYLETVHQGLRHRSTSHHEDKLLCFAIMLHCDMDLIQAEDDLDLRTIRVFQQLEYIPRNFLWHDQPTLDIPGFRWAPKDIFSVDTFSDSLNRNSVLTLSDRGLLVNARGIVYLGRYMTDTIIRIFTTGEWYFTTGVEWESSNKPSDGAVVKSDAPWTALALLVESTESCTDWGGIDDLNVQIQRVVIIRLDCDPILTALRECLVSDYRGTTAELYSNYAARMISRQKLSDCIRSCHTISGEFLGRASLKYLNQKESGQYEQYFNSGEDFKIVMIEEQQLVCEGEIREFPQNWCVTL